MLKSKKLTQKEEIMRYMILYTNSAKSRVRDEDLPNNEAIKTMVKINNAVIETYSKLYLDQEDFLLIGVLILINAFREVEFSREDLTEKKKVVTQKNLEKAMNGLLEDYLTF